MSRWQNTAVGLSVQGLCACFGYTRQAYYKRLRYEVREAEQINRVLQLVRMHRCRQPYLGTRKLHRLINQHLAQAGEDVIGRDWLFEQLRSRGFLVRRKKRGTRTTQSYHHFGRYRNLIRHMLFDGPGQAVVCDITYLRTQEGFAYLALITDLWSRKIVGWDLCNSLAVEGALRALEMAQKQLGRTAGVIHHSDQGIQYCCHAYTQAVQNAQMQLSMTEDDHAAENAVAERVNGILKNELNLDSEFRSVVQARMATAEAVTIYNCERPHLSLDYETPEMRHAA